MFINMIGIDYTHCDIETREIFSLTQSKCIEACKTIFDNENCDGCIIISTCNRTEIWVDGCKNNLIDLFLQFKNLDKETYNKYFIQRTENEAINYLFSLTSGMESQIFGEDQILTQVKNAVLLSRENKTINSNLEVLFRKAITCAKSIKTKVKLSHNDNSIPQKAISILKDDYNLNENSTCLVIGNGEMGVLTSSILTKLHCKTFMTVRQYKYHQVNIPEGVTPIPYDDRVEYLQKSDFIFSATASPHYTINITQLENINSNKRIFIDMAVPRDIDPLISNIPNQTILNMDSLGICTTNLKESYNAKLAYKIIDKYIFEFYHWFEFKTNNIED